MSEVFEHGYAVVIGVDDNNIKRLALPAVEKDVSAVRDVLVHPERCGYAEENVRFLKGEESTGKNIKKAFIWLKDKVSDDPEATAVIYYSGHGFRDKKSERYYLIPYDIESLQSVRVDGLKAEDIQTEISEIRAKSTLIILDCCHASGMDVKDIDPDEPEMDSLPFPELPEVKNVPVYEEGAKDVSDLSDGSGRAILNSSTGIESSYVRPDQAMSVFTYHLIEALTGHAPHDEDDDKVLVTDVMSYVTRNVQKTVAKMNKSQTPVMRTEGVFPIAMLIGGEGVGMSKGLDFPPDPLEPLPEAAGFTATYNFQGQSVGGDQVIAGSIGGDVTTGDRVENVGGDFVKGDSIKKEGGAHVGDGSTVTGPVIGGNVGEYVGGNKTEHTETIHGDKVGGDKVGGNKVSIGSVSGGAVAIGDQFQSYIQR